MPWTSIPKADWKNRPSVHRSRPDPYCIWAELTDWALYPGITLPRAPDRLRHIVIIELVNSDPGTAETFIDLAARNEIAVPESYDPRRNNGRRRRFLTARATRSGLAALADTAQGKPGHLVDRFDLCDFVEPLRKMQPVKERPGREPPTLRGSQLIGIVDDGCGFAHASFVRFDGAGVASTRVAAIWDQDEHPIFMHSRVDNLSKWGEDPGRFDYGRRIYRDYTMLPDNNKRPRGLDEWIAHHRKGVAGSIDEDACYANAGYDSMRRRAAHGVHIMDVLAGPVRQRERMYVERHQPPGWQRTVDPAADPSQSDIVFVQLPRAGLQDTSGGWLDAHVLDAVRCISDWRAPGTAQAVVSISYGSNVGPHDGSSILAQALNELLTAESTADASLELFMATGNSFGARGHGVLHPKANEEKELVWRVLPSGEAPSFLQLWLPCDAAAAAGVKVSVTAPGGETTVLETDHVSALQVGARTGAVAAFVGSPSRGQHAMVLLALAPTLDQSAQPGATAPHGDWLVKVKAAGADLGCVHAYVAANEKRMAGQLRGRQSYLVDVVDRGNTHLAAPHDDPNTGNLFDNALHDQTKRADKGYVRRRGTVSGTASGQAPYAIAGYRRNFTDTAAAGSHSSYSSAGMSGDPRGRTPDAAFPTDQSCTLRGMRAAGTRSGSTFRMVGTSSAAPQRARALLAGKGPPGLGLPAPNDPDLEGTEGRWPIE